jgi:GT2 family glycosyltransferase
LKTSLTHKENAAPVALIFFNRAEQTMRVLQAIIKAEPKVIILISDGARVNVAGEHDTVEEIRQAAISLIPKTIRTEKLFAPYNLGCAHRVSSGIDYVLRKYGEAIFLEDDCLPSPAFFPYVQQKLSEYRHVKNIGSITGSRLMHSGTSKANGVTPYPIIWGWATWLRAWDGYTLDVKDFKPEELDYLLTNKITDSRGLSEWKRLLRFAQV